MKTCFKIFIFLLIAGQAYAEGDVVLLPDAKVSTDQESTHSIKTLANVTIITAKQIKLMGATDITQILRHYAGLQVQDLYGDGSQVQLSMSGFGDNSISNVKVLLNGIPLNNPDLGSLDLNRVVVQNIERIEIFNGSSAVLYGDGAVGGVINIITKQPAELKGNIGLSAGSYAQRMANANVSDSVGNWQYFLSGQKKQSDGFRENNDTDSGNYEAQIQYNFRKSSVALHVQQIEDNQQYPGTLTATEASQDPTQIGTDYGDYHTIERITELFFKNHFNDHWMMNGRVSTRHLDGYGEIGSSFNEQQYVHTANPELMGVYATKNGALVSTTGIYTEQDLYELSYIATQDKRNISALYSQLVLPIAVNWQLIGGLRYAQARSSFEGSNLNTEDKNKAFINSLGIAWQATKDLRWYLTRAGNYRFPKLDEAESVPSNSSALQTQTGISYETGLDYRWQQWDTRFDVYQLDLRHEIAYDPTPTPAYPYGTNTNLDPTRRRGLLLTEALQIFTNWQIGTQYANVNGVFTSGSFYGNRIPLVAQNQITTFSTLNFWQAWSWYISSSFVGDRYPGGDNANLQDKLSSTTVFNTNISYHIKNWDIAFRINNFTNKQYVESAFVNTSNQVGYYPAPGINILFSINYEF